MGALMGAEDIKSSAGQSTEIFSLSVVAVYQYKQTLLLSGYGWYAGETVH